MSTLLEVINLRKEFGGVLAVNDNNFIVEEGSRVGIIGPNGAGKTTSFNMISGAFKPTSGKIIFQGKEIQGLKPHKVSRLGIGRTFQNVRAFQSLTVYDHILTGILAHNLKLIPSKEQYEMADYILEITNLDKMRTSVVGDLTIALQRKIELATALATKPTLLLLDENMAGLTYVEINETLELLRKVNKEMGITLIVVEHIMKVIMELCEKIIVLNYGTKIAEGPPQEVANNKEVIEAYLGEESEYA
ncbi:MAG: ABC transporter ATP-binding protein [Spirochaetales bacterium]|nr:ABC transporter ATP-binding protein [Spirochaetales bacterium]